MSKRLLLSMVMAVSQPLHWSSRISSTSTIASNPSFSRFSQSNFQKRHFCHPSAHLNENREFVIVGGGNSAGYLAHAFVDNGMAEGKLCIVSKENVPPYERPALTKGYLFPLDKSPARLPGFHTCVGVGWERQTEAWYKEKGIEVLYGTEVSGLDTSLSILKTSSGETVKYGNLIIATGATAIKLPISIGGNLQGVHYIRDVSDADALISDLKSTKKIVVIGGGYIGMEVSAATASWNLDTTVVFPEECIMSRLFTSTIARKYEELYEGQGVKFVKGTLVKRLVPDANGRVCKVELGNGTALEADTVVVGVGAKPAAGPFLDAGLETAEGGLKVDGQFRTSVHGIYAIGDVAAFPLKMYGRIARVEHVDHARKSALHCADAILKTRTDLYDYLPYFYSRVFEHSGSSRRIWWQFYGDNVGEVVEIGNLDPKLGAFWISSGRLKGIFLESGSPEEFALLPRIAKAQPYIEASNLRGATSVEEALNLLIKATDAMDT